MLPRLFTFLHTAISRNSLSLGDEMRNPAFFSQSLESIYYFRMRVPTNFQPIFKRTELKNRCALGARPLLCAGAVSMYVAAVEQIFESWG